MRPFAAMHHPGPLFLLPLLPLLLLGCGQGDRSPAHTADGYPVMPGHWPHGATAVDLLAFDPVQRTCALYVALRSNAWDGPIAFGTQLDDSMVHWNMCPGGTMVACAAPPTASGDTVRTGIPWPY